MRVKFFFVILFSFLTFSVFSLSEGELLFTQNKPKEAIPLLEAEIAGGSASADAYNYLGLAYFQIGDYKSSAEAFDNALKAPNTNKKVISFNQGNSYYAAGEYEKAVSCYSFTLNIDQKYSKAVLNRANSYLMLQKYTEAAEDYNLYLKLEPKNEQKAQIKQLLALLKEQQLKMKQAAEEEALAQKMLEEAYSDDNENQINAVAAEKYDDDDEEAYSDDNDAQLYELANADQTADGEGLSYDQQKMLNEDAAILEEGRLAEERRLAELRKLQAEKDAAEARLAELERLEAERAAEAKRQEEFKQTEERLLQYETERRRKMLEEVANSLNTDSTNLSSGVESIMQNEAEPELD